MDCARTYNEILTDVEDYELNFYNYKVIQGPNRLGITRPAIKNIILHSCTEWSLLDKVILWFLPKENNVKTVYLNDKCIEDYCKRFNRPLYKFCTERGHYNHFKL